MKIDVLDYGFVRLIDHMGTDLSIVRNARVSHDAAWRTGEDAGKDEKLINYLYTNSHNTPFESVQFTFEVKAPIFVFRQWHRHRTWCLAGETRVRFRNPSGKIYHKTMKELAEAWHAPLNDVVRPDKQTRTLRDFNRDRITGMAVECIEGMEKVATTSITDVLLSGVKKVMLLTSECGKEIKASENHRFLTPKGWRFLCELEVGDEVLTVGRIAVEKSKECPPFNETDFHEEEWKPITGEVSVSSIGRVRRHGKEVAPTVNGAGRSVISIKRIGTWRTEQVSQLVASAFLKGEGHVLHYDDCPSNNRVSNLHYGSAKENHDDARKNGRRVFNGVTTLTVASIEPAGEEMTYDIEVAHPDHNFIAEGFCVHNSYNEVSARYTELPEEFYVPTPEAIGKQSGVNHQARDIDGQVADIDDALVTLNYMAEHNASAFELYRNLIADDVPRELARSVLPVATYSHMFASVNLHNLFRFLDERLHEHAQYEIRVYAEAMLKLIEPIVPVAVAAWKTKRGMV